MHWAWKRGLGKLARFANGVRVVVRHGNDVLLIRHSYGHPGWGIPGGLMKPGEDPLLAGVRETLEETGIPLRSVTSAAGSPIAMKRGSLWLFEAVAAHREHRIDEVEIVEARWFPSDNLPPDLSDHARETLGRVGLRAN